MSILQLQSNQLRAIRAFMEIPYQSLKKELLVEMLKEIVTRDGTDYGMEEKTIEAKIASAMSSLERGKACLYWDEETETASLHAASDKPT